MKAGYTYIMASRRNGTIYTGSTSNLVQRTYQHRTGMVDGFTKEHGCKLLVWFGVQQELQDARNHERQIKKWERLWKLRLIEEGNPDWDDLYESLF